MIAMEHQRPGGGWIKVAWTVALLCFACPCAEAHLVTTGLGPVYDGIAHLALSPADLAILVALVLLAAMRGAHQGRWLLAVLPTAWLVGGVGGLMFPWTVSVDWANGLVFLVAGALVAADCNLPSALVMTMASIIGGFLGFSTGTGLTGTSSAALELIGMLGAVIVVVTLVAGVVVSLKAFWMRVAVRVLGSWVAATGLLMIGWSLRAGNQVLK